MRVKAYRLIIFIALIGVMPLRSAAADEAKFIQALADQAISVLSDKGVALEERERRFQNLLQDGFAMTLIGRFVVGRHWKAMTPDQQAEYQALFAAWVLKSYSARLGGYSGQKFEIDRTAKAGQNDVYVRTRIVQPDSGPLRCDWRVRRFQDQYKVIDVVVEGVSMLSTQRAEYNAVLRQHGPEGLIEALQTRLTKFPAKAG
ncbi:MAG: ABC transporter substrate-binding protein [Alphaproteobacteria bacterium]|nr:ABC transporter substrate-binding protein [Alphaproteobacteria bacterium]